MKEIVLIVLFISLIVFAIGGIIWFFIDDHLRTKRYFKWLERLDEIDRGGKYDFKRIK